VVIGTADRWQLWIGDWARNTWTPCPECSNAGPPVPAVWSPNGRQLLVQAGGDSLVAHTVDGSAPNRLVTREPGKDLRPAEWLNDGRIVYLSGDVTSSEQRITILEPGATAGRVIAVGWAPAVSPDRHWLAYGTGAAAEANVFIQAFPSGQRRQVSAAGGSDPAWSSDGRTLYYLKSVSSDPTGYGSMLFAVDVATASDLTLSAPRFLFQTASRSLGLIRCYEVTRDSRFLIRDAGERPHSTVTQMDLILNWTSTLPK
jgi:serine/threonine-protein kinase